MLQEARIQDLENLTFLPQDENTDTIEGLKIWKCCIQQVKSLQHVSQMK